MKCMEICLKKSATNRRSCVKPWSVDLDLSGDKPWATMV